jgi:hypothetical protein
MMTSVALKAPLAAEPMLDALRALNPRSTRAFDVDPIRTAAPAEARALVVSATADTTLTRPIRWAAPAENLWLLSIKNFGLTLATFGVYHFCG